MSDNREFSLARQWAMAAFFLSVCDELRAQYFFARGSMAGVGEKMIIVMKLVFEILRINQIERGIDMMNAEPLTIFGR